MDKREFRDVENVPQGKTLCLSHKKGKAMETAIASRGKEKARDKKGTHLGVERGPPYGKKRGKEAFLGLEKKIGEVLGKRAKVQIRQLGKIHGVRGIG